MISLQAFPAFDGDANLRLRTRPAWAVRMCLWLRGGAASPLILRRVAPHLPRGGETAAGRPSLGELGEAIADAALQRAGRLMNAYVASAVDVALEVEALGDGTPARQVRTPIHDLVAEVADALQPCARAAGATLAYDRDSRWSCVAVTDPGRLRKGLSHLALRAMSGAGPGALVRILVTAGPGAARIGVLAVGGAPDPGPFDLAALVRLVGAIGGSLVVEPARAGCTPIAIVLPVARLAAPALAYGSRRPAVRAEIER